MFPEAPETVVLGIEPEEEIFITEGDTAVLNLQNRHPERSVLFKVKISEGGNAVVQIRPCGGLIGVGGAAQVELRVLDRTVGRPVYRLLVSHVLAPKNVHSGSARIFWGQVAAQNIAARSAKLDLVLRQP